MQKTIYRLEQALSYWEDFCFGLSTAYQLSMCRGESPASGLKGLLVNYQDLRKSMLDVFSSNDGTEFVDKFLFPKEAYPLSNDTQAMYFPYSLLAWSKNSRRVFNLSRDLQVLLDATSLEGVVWGDVKLPFDSFVVTLEQPLVDAKNVPFDSVLVSTFNTERGDHGQVFQETAFISLDSRLGNYPPLSREAKEQVTSLLKNGSYRKAEHALMGLYKGSRHNISTSVFVIDNIFVDTPVLDFGVQLGAQKTNIEKRPDDHDPGPLFESVLRIVVGMCLYLKTLPIKTHLVSDWEKPELQQSQRGGAITNKAQVCTVSSQFKLSSEEHEAFGGKEGEPVKSFGEKCCHFRRGTWCRPSGHGDDPNYPRTIWRRPTIVRPDRLGPGELPKGAETILLK